MDIGYQRPRDLISPDLQLVSDATSILRLREFDLFRAAPDVPHRHPARS